MTLIDRYTNAVAQYLPVNRRAEITRELRANILDRIEHLSEQNDRDLSTAEIAEVLRDIGHPQQVASQFLPRQTLVSEEFFPQFKEALYYTLIICLVVHLVKKGAAFLNAGTMNFSSLLFDFTDTALLVFALITGIFYVLSNPPGGKPLFTPYASWKPDELPALDRPWQKISFGEQAGELAINCFFLLVLHYPLWASAEALANLRMTFSEPVAAWIPWMTVLVIGSILLNLWNFRYGFWSKSKLVISGVINVGCALILLILSRQLEIFTLVPGAEMRIWGTAEANEFSRVGFVLTGLWLLYEAGRDFYRAHLLGRSVTMERSVTS